MQSLDLIFCYEEQQLNASTRELDDLIDEAAVVSARQRKMRGAKRLIDFCYTFSGMTSLRETPHAPYFGSTPCRVA